MATIVEMLDQIIALASALKGDAPPEAEVPPPAPSKYVDGKSAPDDLGRVELELVDRLAAEFGDAPNGYRIPKLWFVPNTQISHLPIEVQGDHGMRVAGAAFNRNLAYTYKAGTGWFGKPSRVPHEALPSCLAWNGTLADLEAALRARIAILLNPNQSDPYRHKPEIGALDTVSGYLALQ